MKTKKIVLELTIAEVWAIMTGLSNLLMNEGQYPNIEVNAARHVLKRLSGIKEETA